MLHVSARAYLPALSSVPKAIPAPRIPIIFGDANASLKYCPRPDLCSNGPEPLSIQ
jgi:hypothetical protein